MGAAEVAAAQVQGAALVNGKGSKQRRPLVPRRRLDRNWARVFSEKLPERYTDEEAREIWAGLFGLPQVRKSWFSKR